MSFDQRTAEKLGWTLETGDGHGTASNAETGACLSVEGATPLFTLLANIAELEGQGFAAGYGGDQPITAALVKKTSGETYMEPPQEPAPPNIWQDAHEALMKAGTVGEVQDALGPLLLAFADPGATPATTGQRRASAKSKKG